LLGIGGSGYGFCATFVDLFGCGCEDLRPGIESRKCLYQAGFYQVYRYLHDFNQPIGYLVVFKGSERLLVFSGRTSNSEQIPYLTINDKTVFLVQIDIFPHDEPANKRGVPEEDVISEADVVAAVSSPQ
jgi:hypothetical protein